MISDMWSDKKKTWYAILSELYGYGLWAAAEKMMLKSKRSFTAKELIDDYKCLNRKKEYHRCVERGFGFLNDGIEKYKNYREQFDYSTIELDGAVEVTADGLSVMSYHTIGVFSLINKLEKAMGFKPSQRKVFRIGGDEEFAPTTVFTFKYQDK